MPGDGLRIARFILVLASLSPLFFLWAIRGAPAFDGICWIVFCAIMIVGPNLFLVLLVVISMRRKNTKTIVIISSKDQSDQLLVYLFAMLIPLFGVELKEPRGVAALIFAVLFIAFIFWHMQLHYMNILFAIFGYRIFTVETLEAGDSPNRQSYAVISRRHSIELGVPLSGFRLGGNVLLDVVANDRGGV
jgi:hypothetical protein